MDLPSKMHELVAALSVNGWSFLVRHETDTGDSPFVSIEAKKRGRKTLRITWHTRDTGTYRLFSCLAGQRSITLTKAMEEATG